MAILDRWTPDKIEKLLNCKSDRELKRAFPGKNLQSLKRRQREFKKIQEERLEAEFAAWSDTPSGWEGGVELVGDRGWLCSGPTDEPVKDWEDLMLIWNLDPTRFEVIDPVTFKAWNGFIKKAVYIDDPDKPGKKIHIDDVIETVRLYSYKATIRRIVSDSVKVDYSEWSAILKEQAKSASSRKVTKSNSESVSYVVPHADSQFGKPGTEEAVQNWQAGINGHVERIHWLSNHYNISEIVLPFMGDEHENVAGHYANQQYDVELSLKQQIELDFDMRAYSLKRLMEVGLPLLVPSVPSNHGELTRNGGKKPVTDQYDNSSTMVTNLIKRMFDEITYKPGISWYVADSSPDVILTTNGVKMHFSHGHIAKGRGRGQEQKVKSGIERQIIGRTKEVGDVDIFVSAHYHHYWSMEDTGRTYIGCPALESEKASDWYLSQYGVWSYPGMLGFLVGSSFGKRKWSEETVI